MKGRKFIHIFVRRLILSNELSSNEPNLPSNKLCLRP